MTPTTRASATLSAHADAPALRERLEARLADHFGRPLAIRKVHRRACPYSSSFRIDEIDVWLDDGSAVRLVLKDLSRDAMLEEARRARPDFLSDARREIGAYASILPKAPSGSATWYGRFTQGADERHWLLLENVLGLPLWQIGDRSAWHKTAGWLGRFHRAFSPLALAQLAPQAGALVYDEAFYRQWFERAVRFAASSPAKQRAVARVEKGFDRAVGRLLRLPHTFIHGEFYPSNVLVKASGRIRICPVDWEMVALGPGLVDLAALTAGWAPAVQRSLSRAYLEATGGGIAEAASQARLTREFLADLDACRLYLAVRMLGWSDRWEPPTDHARNWLVEAGQLAERLAR